MIHADCSRTVLTQHSSTCSPDVEATAARPCLYEYWKCWTQDILQCMSDRECLPSAYYHCTASLLLEGPAVSAACTLLVPVVQAADLDLLLCIFVVLSSAASTRTEQEQFASRAYSYAVAMLHASLVLVEDHPTPGPAPC